MFNKNDMSASGEVPTHLHTCIPASIVLRSLLPIQIPKHAAIEVTTINLNSIKNLLLISKAEGLPDGGATVYELSLLSVAVIVHGSILM